MVAPRRPLMRLRVGLAAATLVAVASACAGSGADKAGGQDGAVAKPVVKPATLTLATVDDLWASEFAAAAARLSGGAIRIEIRVGGSALIDYERRLVGNVRAGKADIASVGARFWDTTGVTSFRGLVAPFLVDSLESEQRVLERSRVDRMLEGVRPLGLVGLAVLPGPLRRPLGLTRSLVGPPDYEGATIGVRYGGVARSTLRALGATTRGYRIGSLAGLDAAELDVNTIVTNGYDAPGTHLTANVVLWARPETIVIGRAAFARLTPAQRAILRRAGREAVAPVRARLEKQETDALAVLCGRGRMTLATASASELAALRAAVRPVYAELERDAVARDVIAALRAHRRSGRPLRCPVSAGGSRLEGLWRSSVTRDALLAHGATSAEAATYEGSATLELRAGRWTFAGEHSSVTGTYVAAGNVVRLTMARCTANPCSPGSSSAFTWTVYRETLSLAPAPGRSTWPQLVVKPWARDR